MIECWWCENPVCQDFFGCNQQDLTLANLSKIRRMGLTQWLKGKKPQSKEWEVSGIGPAWQTSIYLAAYYKGC